MREITTKYDGQCRRCGKALEVGQTVMYEKSMGIFCPGCEPTDPEEIREFRLAKKAGKAAKYENGPKSGKKKPPHNSTVFRQCAMITPLSLSRDTYRPGPE